MLLFCAYAFRGCICAAMTQKNFLELKTGIIKAKSVVEVVFKNAPKRF